MYRHRERPVARQRLAVRAPILAAAEDPAPQAKGWQFQTSLADPAPKHAAR